MIDVSTRRFISLSGNSRDRRRQKRRWNRKGWILARYSDNPRYGYYYVAYRREI